ncbi:ATP-binding protein [Streptomyces longwoodensis]|uniref:AlbA family DNA-binding domain-containing protein n=1 Tax=Streptomyces longwoodensis TaxID=68231 RepID=UPI002DD90F9A|nr:ATP-binding protein [Streptomyces longwoodensis]WRY92864.1 ATP-binding protein [Streptomyces longwoodensis]
MARSWTRLHEYLGHPPGPVTYDMVAEAVRRKLGESDDLDWKEALPAEPRVKGEWNEFAKDVAAMANTRGGLLVYGVSDAIERVGIDLDKVNDKQLGQWLRVHLQPTVSGVSYLKLPATDGSGKDLLVVDVPASEMAPHFLYGWQQKDKDRTTFNAPYRHRDDTDYMSEYQVALAYRGRFARQDAADAALNQHVRHTTELVLGESENHAAAWLVVAARPTRPIPRMVPALSRAQAQHVMSQSSKRAASLLASAIPMPRLLGPQLFPHLLDNNPRKGLRRWVDTNMLVPARATHRCRILVELHHDGTVVTAVDLSHSASPYTGVGEGEGDVCLPVAAWVLISAAFETVSLVHEHRLALHAGTPIDLCAALESGGGFRFVPVVVGHRRPEIAEWARQPRTIQPAHTELAPFSDDQALIAAATDLAEGLLHQFGMDILQT